VSNASPPDNAKTLTPAQEKLPARLFNAAMLLLIAGAAFCDPVTAWVPAVMFAVCLAAGHCWPRIKTVMRFLAFLTVLAWSGRSIQAYALLHADPADGEVLIFPASVIWATGLMLAMLVAESLQNRRYRQINRAWKGMLASFLLTLTVTVWKSGIPAIDWAATTGIMTGFIMLLPGFLRLSGSDEQNSQGKEK
jgi:hypothetical protein